MVQKHARVVPLVELFWLTTNTAVTCDRNYHFTYFLAILSSPGGTTFAKNFFGAWLRTMTMVLGEFQYINLQYGNIEGEIGDNLTPEQKWQIFMARLIFMGFVFVFPLVIINLLNAVAIGDVQVSSGEVFSE